MGFAGYFEVKLFKNILLSTHPKRHTINLQSWFPALFPLQKLIELGENASSIAFNISRKVDDGGVWYEWFAEIMDNKGRVSFTAPLQNKDGFSQYMRLNN